MMELSSDGPNRGHEMARELMARILDALDLADAVDAYWSTDHFVFSAGH